MRRTLDIALKDLMQILRDRKTFLFLLIMPIAFTYLFGSPSVGSAKGKKPDPRLPVGHRRRGHMSRDRCRPTGKFRGHPLTD